MWSRAFLAAASLCAGCRGLELQRRQFLALAPSAAVAAAPGLACAEDAAPAWKKFADPEFELSYPPSFYKGIRRNIEGDVVRRGGVIFTTGQLAKAEVVTVEKLAVSSFLEQAGATEFFPSGKISKWADLGNPDAVGELLCERRDNDAQQAAKGQPKARSSRVVGKPVVSADGRTITADIVTEIGQTKARVGDGGNEYETPAVVRLQRAKLTIMPSGQRVLGVWASCLEDLWNDGEGEVLKRVVDSFVPYEPAPVAA